MRGIKHRSLCHFLCSQFSDKSVYLSRNPLCVVANYLYSGRSIFNELKCLNDLLLFRETAPLLFLQDWRWTRLICSVYRAEQCGVKSWKGVQLKNSPPLLLPLLRHNKLNSTVLNLWSFFFSQMTIRGRKKTPKSKFKLYGHYVKTMEDGWFCWRTTASYLVLWLLL